MGILKSTANMKIVLKVFKKLTIEVSYNPAIPLLGIYQKERKAGTEQVFAGVALFVTVKR